MGEKASWHRKPCDMCGVEGLASRAEPRDVDAPYLCETCEVHEQYKDHIPPGDLGSKPSLDDEIERRIVSDFLETLAMQVQAGHINAVDLNWKKGSNPDATIGLVKPLDFIKLNFHVEAPLCGKHVEVWNSEGEIFEGTCPLNAEHQGECGMFTF